MFVVAVTGGIGAGKTEVARHLAARGAVVLDADRIAAEAIEPAGPAFAAVVEAFGRGIVRSDGTIDRHRLAGLAFDSAEATRRLNAAVHPHVTAEIGRRLAALEAEGSQSGVPLVAVIDVPLLGEVPELAQRADRVLAVEAPEHVRVARAVARGVTEDDARRRIAVQDNDDARASLADDTLVNDGSLADLHAAVDAWWDREVAPHA